jgi:tetratricopeptide (TPR) repeat protein
MRYHRGSRSLALVTLLAGIVPGGAQTRKNTSTSAVEGQLARRQVEEAYQKGLQLLQTKHYLEALDEFQQLEKLAPNLPQGPSGEGIALALLGKPEQAVDKLKRALAIDSSFWIARRELGILYWHQGLKELAVKELAPLAQTFPDDVAVNLILGQYNFGQKQYAKALEFFAKTPGQVARQPRLALMQADAYLKTGKNGLGSSLLEQLTLRQDLSNEQRFQLAWLLGEAQKYKAAIKIFESLPPDYPDAFHRAYGLALAYFEDGDNAQCVKTLKQIQVQGSMQAEGYSLLGVAEEKSGHTKEAYDSFRQGILDHPDNQQNYLNIATLSCQHLSYDLAVQILTSGIERIPHSHELVLSRGIAYTLKVNFSAAERDLQKAIQMAPEDPQGYFSLGLCLLEKGDLKGSVRAFEEEIAKKPKDPLPYYFVTEALIQNGAAPGTPDFTKALQAIQTALSIQPGFAHAYRDRAKLELRAGNTEKALGDLERAHTLAPEANSINYLLAQTYQRMGEHRKAQKLFAEVKEKSEKDAEDFRQDSLTKALVVISNRPH